MSSSVRACARDCFGTPLTHYPSTGCSRVAVQDAQPSAREQGRPDRFSRPTRGGGTRVPTCLAPCDILQVSNTNSPIVIPPPPDYLESFKALLPSKGVSLVRPVFNFLFFERCIVDDLYQNVPLLRSRSLVNDFYRFSVSCQRLLSICGPGARIQRTPIVGDDWTIVIITTIVATVD